MKLLQTLSLQSTHQEIERVEELLLALQKKLGFNDELFARLQLTVSEAATNSLIHGNKLNPEKAITIRAFEQEGKLIFEIKDEGKGFEPKEIPDPTAEENLLKTGGRGLFLMKEYADKVQYLENGTKLRLEFSLSD